MIEIHDRLIPKYPKIYRYGHKKTENMFDENSDFLKITEKIDGANGRCGFVIDDFTIYFVVGSHNKIIYVKNVNNGFIIHNEAQECFMPTINYLEKIQRELWNRLKNDYIMYFENIIPHTINYYKWDEMKPCYVFGIYNINREKWEDNILFINDINNMLLYRNNEEFENYLCEAELVDFMPVMEFKNNFTWNDYDILSKEIIPESNYADEGKAEGVVIENIRTGQRCKIVSRKFKETFKKKWPQKMKSKKKNKPMYVIEFINQYVTKTRLDKKIYELRDEEYGSICMQMMINLPDVIIDDILKEEDIDREQFNKFKKHIRGKVKGKCVAALKEKIEG